MFKLVVGVGAVLLLFAMGGCQAVPQDVVQLLPEAQGRELAVYSKNHAVLFDLRIHSMDTCPFLTYLPNSMSMNHDSKEWAAWLLQFYRAKHQEEHGLYNCTCEQELRAPPAEASPPPRK